MNQSQKHAGIPRRSMHGPAGWRFWLVLAGFSLSALILLLWEEHEDHILGALPYLILLACPLMHVFMHHGHGHGPHERGDDDHGA
jgi:hypothetical protein